MVCFRTSLEMKFLFIAISIVKKCFECPLFMVKIYAHKLSVVIFYVSEIWSGNLNSKLD